MVEIKQGADIKIIKGIYKGKAGKLEVVVPDALCSYGVRITPTGDDKLPPLVWYKPEEIEAMEERNE